ncbi:MAG: hypothetical protein K8I00_10130, partial [Candidatus Omnitrophica bacterium]|nr:hypothetical protein [Candidatus Omnitrophota bacterium]
REQDTREEKITALDDQEGLLDSAMTAELEREAHSVAAGPPFIVENKTESGNTMPADLAALIASRKERASAADRVRERQAQTDRSHVLDFYGWSPSSDFSGIVQDDRSRRDAAFIAELNRERWMDSVRWNPQRLDELVWDLDERDVIEEYFINPFEQKIMVGGAQDPELEPEGVSVYAPLDVLQPEPFPHRALIRAMTLPDLARRQLLQVRQPPRYPGKVPLSEALKVPGIKLSASEPAAPEDLKDREKARWKAARWIYDRYLIGININRRKDKIFLWDALQFNVFNIVYDPRLYPGSEFPYLFPVNLHNVYKPLKLPDVVIVEVPRLPCHGLVILPIQDVVPVPITALPDYKFVLQRLKLLEQYLPPEPPPKVLPGPVIEKTIDIPLTALPDRKYEIKRLRFLRQYLPVDPVVDVPLREPITVRIIPMDKTIQVPVIPFDNTTYFLERLAPMIPALPVTPVSIPLGSLLERKDRQPEGPVYPVGTNIEVFPGFGGRKEFLIRKRENLDEILDGIAGEKRWKDEVPAAPGIAARKSPLLAFYGLSEAVIPLPKKDALETRRYMTLRPKPQSEHVRAAIRPEKERGTNRS